VIPSIPKIQQLIEAAWAKGFDQQGREQLGNKVTNTTKWIGATEIAASLYSLKVKYVGNKPNTGQGSNISSLEILEGKGV
jgi:hypothetical protein